MNRLKPPIRYYGGKYYMTDIIIKNFPEKYDMYVEVFGGGGSVLLAKPQTPNEVYNDLDRGVYSLFKCLQDKDLFGKLKNKLDKTYYHSDIRGDSVLFQHGDVVDTAFWFFIKSRTSYNGVGGFSRNFVVRRNMSKSVSDFLSAIDGLPTLHQRLSSVLIENEDFEAIIDRYDRDGTFMYMDPPYIISERLSSQKYNTDMNLKDHERLVKRLETIKANVLISGYEHGLYNSLGWEKVTFKSPNAKSTATECLWANYDLTTKEGKE